jgi:DNA processing protein
MTNSLPYWIAALHLPQIGPRTFLRWLEQFPDIQSLFHATDEDRRAKGFSDSHILLMQQVNWKQVEKDLEWANKSDHHIIHLEDEDYPKLLKEISDPPLILYVRGNRQVLSNRQLAMVGARNATPTGIKNAEYFAFMLAEAGYVVTSGLALGVDGASHRGALKAKGVTIGVCGTGLNYVYPSSHRSLATKMLEQGGAIISEFPLSIQPRSENFPRRNRIIAGMSLGVLVVEAAIKSGSLITARHALEQGREVFAIPGSIHQPLSKGCHHLIRQGAKLIETIEDILEELGGQAMLWPVVQKFAEDEDLSALSVSERRVLEQIEHEITPMDVILFRAGLTAGEVSSMLLLLELNGYIQSVPGGYIRSVLKSHD